MRTVTAPQHEITSTLTCDEIEELARLDHAAGIDPTITVPRISIRMMEAITGPDDVILTSSDGAVFLGEIQDWDDCRMEIVVELH